MGNQEPSLIVGQRSCLNKEQIHVYHSNILFDNLEPFVREDRDFVVFLANLTDDTVASSHLLERSGQIRRVRSRRTGSSVSIILDRNDGNDSLMFTLLKFTDDEAMSSAWDTVKSTRTWRHLFGNRFKYRTRSCKPPPRVSNHNVF